MNPLRSSNSHVPLARLFLGMLLSLGLEAKETWQPAPGPLLTRWAQDVSPNKVLPEYPRPQMVRQHWQNLNGLWDYAITAKAAPQPTAWDGSILVPFPVESALSGVMKRVSENERLWYQRSFDIPRNWKDQQTLLHFGAVDWETTVWINGTLVSPQPHRGGYDAFTYDITSALEASGPQQIVVSVWDPSDAGHQARGKQVRNPHGIWYTPTTGIWQTVWLEPVPATHIQTIHITPDLDNASVTLTTTAQVDGTSVTVEAVVKEGRSTVQKASLTTDVLASDAGRVQPRITLPIPDPKPWSPDMPFLYDLQITLLQDDKPIDRIQSYFGLRKIAVAPDTDGTQRLFLNHQPLFQYGPLDQGFWPDGLYTAPTDEALRYDIEITKQLGFNMARKHVKIEPARWYYWCDRLGLLIWQDMPSGNFGGRNDQRLSDEASAQYELELQRLVQGFYNHPSIVMWVPFNEGWGQHETARYVDLIRLWDPTRLVNNASGWTDRQVGDVLDIHSYPGPAAPRREETRAGVLGEFGGLGLPVPNHTWQAQANWGYRSYEDSFDLTDAYLTLLDKLHPLTGAPGLAAAVYTQTTDVEIEVNGLLTYDRALIKMDAKAIAEAANQLYTPPEKRVDQANSLVPPSTPLIACDPYFSIWSPADRLTDAETVHWTGKPHRLTSLVRIDGHPYRIMGPQPRRVPPLQQTDLTVLPTQTIYTFEGAGVALTLTFTTATLPEDLDVLSRPVTYLTWSFRSLDQRKHEVEIYFDASAEIAVNDPRRQTVNWNAERIADLTALRLSSEEQPILAKNGDDLRIDWGHFYIAAPDTHTSTHTFAGRGKLQRSFAANGLRAVQFESLEPPTAAEHVAAALTLRVGVVGPKPVSRWLILAYDDLYSIQYFQQNLRPYWRRHGWNAASLLTAAAQDYSALMERCTAFDQELMTDLTRAGGAEYARIAALAYRQCFAASKFVADGNGQVMSFSKECFSNGCIGTSDVFYPMAPQFLLFGPSLAKSFLVPFMNYAASPRWKFPFAPHDLGRYPHANGQRYGGRETSEDNQMPVEESANLLILMAAVADMEGHAKFAELYWPQLEQWADYLKIKGFDPDNQLCTDDFAGHLAHNVNLSAKAICGLASFAKLCALRGDQSRATEYHQLALTFAQQWIEAADDGDHFRLAFDRPGTWSQKYNLVWDRILGFDLFPDSVREREMAHYRSIQNRYGLPLDNRSTYTKLDWILWTATLTQSRQDFLDLVLPVHRFLNETPDRVPMTDWYWTEDARVRGFRARPVVGGVFLQMLYDKSTWTKYASRDITHATGWAPFPNPPHWDPVLPTAEEAQPRWHYTTSPPAQGWYQPTFDDANWSQGPAGFGTAGTPGANVRTEWNTGQIWLRREFNLTQTSHHNLHLRIHHDEDAEVFLNGVRVAALNGYTTEYLNIPLSQPARESLRIGRNVLAIHCRQTSGGQYIDAGFADLVPGEKP